LDPPVASWPLYAFNKGLDWLCDRANAQHGKEGEDKPSLEGTLLHFERILEEKLTLTFPKNVVSPNAVNDILEEAEELGWRGRWTGQLLWAPDRNTLILTPAGDYGLGTVNLKTPLRFVSSADLGVKEIYAKWFVQEEAKFELLIEGNRRRMAADEQILAAAVAIQNARAIEAYANKL
ncbi:MAG: hypothetical protein NUV56_00520, partial [Candidatus Uhrbacteria bacterium]|nr:hypothetical protein [Candidatus Uhrbacteria bacterium]